VNAAARALIHIVDDDESIRRSLRGLVESVGHAAATYSSAQDFLTANRPDTPGCLVLDVQMPGLSGLDLQRQLVAGEGALPIIFLTGRGNIPMSVQAMKAGAVEFLTKPIDAPALLAAIGHAIETDRAVRAERSGLDGLRRRYESLTRRERDVMHGIVAGRLNKQIAAEFGTTEATVKEQRGQVMHKMAADSLAALVRVAERLGISSKERSYPTKDG
jgi:FixJ family two-component response regulator